MPISHSECKSCGAPLPQADSPCLRCGQPWDERNPPPHLERNTVGEDTWTPECLHWEVDYVNLTGLLNAVECRACGKLFHTGEAWLQERREAEARRG